MKIIVRPSVAEGEITANPSKSLMQRAVGIAAFYQTQLTITNPCLSTDCLAALQVASAMGCQLIHKNNIVDIIPGKTDKSSEWHIGESGLAARMFGVLAALHDKRIRISGLGSILNRPLPDLLRIYDQLGVRWQSNGLGLPVEVQGPPVNFNLNLDGSESSQSLTGLLIGLPNRKNDSKISVKDLKSTSYIDLTIRQLKQFGIEVEQENYQVFNIEGGQKINISLYQNEGDWSGAAFFLIAGAVGGKTIVQGLDQNSKQGDKRLVGVLRESGVFVEEQVNQIIIKRNKLSAFSYDATDTPDLFPPLAVLGALSNGTSRIKGLSRLKHKESNRYEAIRLEFGKLGVEIGREGDWMTIKGANVKGGEVNSHGDHRMAMALAVLAMNGQKELVINDFDCVSKSYPDFLKDFEKIGGDYEILDA